MDKGEMMATWRELIRDEMEDQQDRASLVQVAPDSAALDVEFNDGYGGEEGKPFLAWTHDRVYFTVCYDGAEWVGSAPRNPTPEGQRHVGGG